MGVCIPFSIKSTLKKKTPLTVSLYNVTRRSIVLFLLGFIWNTSGTIKNISQSIIFFIEILQVYATLHKISYHRDFLGWINLGRLRIPGVLQRFGISYFVVASTGMIFKASFEQTKFVSIRRLLLMDNLVTYQISICIYK